MKRFLTIIPATAVSLLMIVIPFVTWAANPGEIPFENPLGKNSDLPTLIQSVVDQLTPFAVTICTLIIIWKGFQYVIASSTGNEGKMKEVKNSFFSILVIIAVVVGATKIIDATIKFGQKIQKK